MAWTEVIHIVAFGTHKLMFVSSGVYYTSMHYMEHVSVFVGIKCVLR